MDRCCPSCKRVLKNARARTQHVTRCHKRAPAGPMYKVSAAGDQRWGHDEHTQQQHDTDETHIALEPVDEDLPWSGPFLDDGRTPSDGSQTLPFRHPLLHASSLSKSDLAGQSATHGRGGDGSSQSTASSIVLEQYHENSSNLGHPGRPLPGCPAGAGSYGLPCSGSLGPDGLPQDIYNPFNDEEDFALARWMFESQLTKGDIDRYFSRNSLEKDQSPYSFHNGATWKEKIDQIAYGIQGDHWNVTPIDISSGLADAKPQRLTIKYRNIVQVIRFLIGHQPFRDNLAYAPVRVWRDSARQVRIYNEMHTGDWWYEEQRKLPADATLVPVLVASDKTQLTQLHGDKSSWPVYVTIGNLDKKTRRNRTRPGIVLLGFIPIAKAAEKDMAARHLLKLEIWHKSMELMFKPLEELSGLRLTCADLHDRVCFPRLGGFLMDYEEQVLLTGVKMNRHCTMCLVPPDERENLCAEPYDFRTPRQMQRDITKQQMDKNAKDADKTMWVHPVMNFAWSHSTTNPYELIHVDILHQLLKGIVDRLLDWIEESLADQVGGAKRRKNDAKTLANARWMRQLEERFNEVPALQKLKLLKNYSHMKQWTGDEQKAVIQQIVPVVAPLLGDAAVQFTRAVVDFVLHAQYTSHDDDTLHYMELALRRIDQLKYVFKDYVTGGHFNFPKFHALSHWTRCIRRFGSADGLDTSHFEAAHRSLVKSYYQLTNKRLDFEEQIARHNTRHINFLAMADILYHARTRPTSRVEREEGIPLTTTAAKMLDLRFLRWGLEPAERLHLRTRRKSHRFWREAAAVAEATQIPDFIHALAVFVREQRRRSTGSSSSNRAMEFLERDPSWVKHFLVCIHPSLHCLKQGQPEPGQLDVVEQESVRCRPNWQRNTDHWRRDFVWVQEHDPRSPVTTSQASSLEGRRPGQLQIILTVLDPDRWTTPRHTERVHEKRAQQRSRTSRRVQAKYTGALVELYPLRNQGRHSDHHGMVEVLQPPARLEEGARSLGARRFYNISLIARSAHILSAGPKYPGVYYVNPYVDFHQYVTVYNRDFEEVDRQVVIELCRKHGWPYHEK